ncbi:MAG: NADH-quinone oxidoreductase subunit L [Acidobacteriota bacterium]|jgi:proton-translocating NADH-quinone oxidoreductase chain N|nr:NADH-quinone oxidoreductase subunit L [Acidobacteriota bacterium]
MNECLLFCLVAVPLFGSLLLPLLGKAGDQARNIFALVLMLCSLGISCFLLPVIAGDQVLTVSVGGVTLFYADKLAIFMALCSQTLGTIIILYSFGYIAHYEHRNEYYFMVVLFLAAMMGLIFSSNLLWIYFFWEITAICCWRLIGFFREREYVLRADKAFFITIFGALMMLGGFLMVYGQTGTFDLLEIKAYLGRHPGEVIDNTAILFILFGILSKSATLPLHTWLPDAGVAPSPVTALLHAAVLVKIGVYVFARLFVATFTVDGIWWEVVPWIAAASALVSACAALVENDIKRIVAYSTVSQLAFILLGLAVHNEVSVLGGLLYILMHGIAKAGLFLCAGVVEHETHNKDIRRMGGLVKTMPVTAVSFGLCAFSVMGLPPFGGFFSKYMVVNGALESGQVAIGLTFVAGAFLTLAYLLRVYVRVFFGASRAADDGHGAPKEGSPIMVFSVALLAALSLLSGVVIGPSFQFAQEAVRQMMGR